MGGPLEGVRIVELVGQGPGPFCGMLLADLGADVLRVDRVGPSTTPWTGTGGPMVRGKASVHLDLKSAEGVEAFLRLTDRADAVIEVFRPGVAERLGIGPDAACARNPRLIYGRLTGFGQEGPLAQAAGHDIDYLAVAGALEPIGRAGQPPTPPLNIVADFAGGGLFLAYGIVAALFERTTSGEGQVIDAAMVDGAALLMTPFFKAFENGSWGPRGTNMLDSGAPFYDVYECADGGWLAVGAIEPQFHAAFLDGLGLPPLADPMDQWDKATWPLQKEAVAAAVRTRTRDEWVAVFEGRDACVTPALKPHEAARHPHGVARKAFTEDGYPMPGPRFSRTPGSITEPADADEPLTAWGFTPDEVADLRARKVLEH